MMNEYSGIVCIVDLYNFINKELIKDDCKFRLANGFVEITQSGTWVTLPKYLNEVMLIPKSFSSGYLRKSDLISLYDQLKFIVDKEGRVPTCYSESFISPINFGFRVYSRYPRIDIPGVKLVGEFRFKVRYRWYHKFLHKLGLM